MIFIKLISTTTTRKTTTATTIKYPLDLVIG